MKISYAVTVCNELQEIKRLIGYLVEGKRRKDEIVILFDSKNGTKEVEEALEVLNTIDWYKLHKIKGIVGVQIVYDKGIIILIQGNNKTIYYVEDKKIEGYTNDVSEDFRDYLRRRGIKIYADRFFRSI